ncbi:MAG TPA: putative baseplate assembly protein [Pyrinomonadaceae bacterium]|jgi:uncharacterized phage protein gp47/JayE
MLVPAPKIDRRDREAILKEVRALAPVYVPEWGAASETGAGAALLKIYAKLLEGLIRRLNDVPTKNFIAFLEMLGVKLLPAQPARAPLTFLLSTGAKEAVAVPARSQAAAAPPAGGDPIVFETERAILATPAKLQSFYSVVPSEDGFYDHAATLNDGALAEVFADTNPNLQEHGLYLAHDDLLNIKSEVNVSLGFTPALAASELNRLKNSVNWQYYGERTEVAGEQKKKTEAWFDFPATEVVAGRLMLTKNNKDELNQTRVNGAKSRWIRGLVKADLLPTDALARLKATKIGLRVAPYSASPDPNAGVLPEAAVAGDIPLELPPSASAQLLPFGPRPRPGDIFYLASQEAFSKKGALIRLDLKMSLAGTSESVKPIPTASLVWEYWNKEGWVLLKKTDTTANLSQNGSVSFACPDDIAPTKVNGVESFWIRVRIAFGDYGQEKVVPKTTGTGTDTQTPEFVLSTEDIHQPQISELKIIYNSDQPPESIVTFNNGEYVVSTENFSPFVPLEDTRPALYFGFDRAPLKGPISIFFSLTEQEYTEKTMPRVEWEYFRKRASDGAGEWARLLIEDGTANLTVSGTVEFIGPQDFMQASRFGSAKYWIRAVDVESKFQPLARILRQKYQGASDSLSANLLRDRAALLAFARGKNPSIRFQNLRSRSARTIAMTETVGEFVHETLANLITGDDLPAGNDEHEKMHTLKKELKVCDRTLESLSPPFGLPPELKDVTLAPLVKGVYLNTAWASQAETIKDEAVGSSSGDADQKYTLTRFPVMDETIYVDELGSLTESERKAFAGGPGVVTEEKKDDQGNVLAFWVGWRRVEDLGEAAAADRVYTIDQTFGLIQFGDGVHGRVPPIGRDNIRATYRAGGGAAGNLAAGEIKTLRTTIPFVEKALNPEATGGGSDTELIEETLERGPQMIKHRGRAITAEDFEWLAREASRVVSRVKCLPTFNDEGKYQTGWVTVIIVPKSTDARPVPSPQLRQRVEKYLSERAPSVVSFPKRVRVSAPVYVEVRLTVDIYPVTMDVAPVVESEALGSLQRFLHPLTGGYENRGWEFGRLPCLSDFYALLEAVAGVDHIENLVMTLQVVMPNGVALGTPRVVTEEKPLTVEMPGYTLLFSGEHRVTTKAPG